MGSEQRSCALGDASTERDGEVPSSFESSLRAGKLDVRTGSVPSENDVSFRSLIKRPLPANRLFEPKDQHCGIWKDSPNKECHASFGDHGTTASVSCYGFLMQMSQFLGAGNSGLFSIDHESTEEPYSIVHRAKDLEYLSLGYDELSFGLYLPGRYLADPDLGDPKVKWVNWRWPRYEWTMSDSNTSATVSFQWLVKNNTVFQQTVVTNTGDYPIEDFSFAVKTQMLIRDLDYLENPGYNRDGSKTYTRVPGPNGFGWITANKIDGERSSAGETNDSGGDGTVLPSVFDLGKGESKSISDDDELWRANIISDTWSVNNAHAVVSVMGLFVDGTAQKMPTGPIFRTIGTSESGSAVLEITLAYRIITIPEGQVHWKNFLIPAEATDVSAILATETELLWGHSVIDDCSCSNSLCDIGISMNGRNERDMERDATAQAQAPEIPEPEDQNTQKSKTKQDDKAVNADPQTHVRTEEVTAAAEFSGKQAETQNPSARPGNGDTTGIAQEPTPSGFIEYLTWRHTEYILSVCIIPLWVPPILDDGEESEPDMLATNIIESNIHVSGTPKSKDEPNVPRALTCGDMSGHRICTSASFFAFDFLLDVLKRLPAVNQTPYILSLQRRIIAACRGHIRWLEWLRKPWRKLEDTRSLLSTGCFAANYWVSGETMPTSTWSWQPDDAIIDTPFQILKVTAYIKWCRTPYNIQIVEDNTLKLCMALLRDVWGYFIHELDDLDKRKVFAWRHASEDGLNTYRLDDHVWIWSSLNELHSLGLWSLAGVDKLQSFSQRWRISKINYPAPEPKPDQGTSTNAWRVGRVRVPYEDFCSKARRLLPDKVKKAVLQRFTVENDVSQERMLAVTRSARETRFFFHTRDTALFYGHVSKFFLPDKSFGELWERTIKSQSHHEETLQEEWQSPLRFALGAVAGLNKFSIDRRSSGELARESVESLIQFSAHNAFIPGEIDVATGKPSIFSEEQDRDYYYHVGFEACHILFKYARDIDVSFRPQHTPARKEHEDNSQQVQRETMDLLSEILAQLKKQNSSNHPHGTDSKALSKHFAADGRFDRNPNSVAMKKSMPFNSMIDASSITTLDEEWLYNYPDFLLTKDIDRRQELKQLRDRESERYINIPSSSNSLIYRELDAYREEKFSFSYTESKAGLSENGLVASLPKQKHQRQGRAKQDNIRASLVSLSNPMFNMTLWESISKGRTAADAKKRFLWLPAQSDSQTAFLCWLASTEAERAPISLFFDRHAAYENHMWDDTTMVLNSWQTELHMCFWVLFAEGESQPLHSGIPDQLEVPWPAGQSKELRRASIGFRFDGDFFDRYWTCHFVEYVPGLAPDSYNLEKRLMSRFNIDKHLWQRKVLELQLLQHILSVMLTKSNNILQDIKDELGLKKGKMILSVFNTEAYSKSANHWQIYEELLGKAEEDLTSSLNTLSKWATREGDRGQERPRWTRNDERKYRGYINKLRSQTERQRLDLEICRDKIRNLKEILTTVQAKNQSELDAKREQNIAYFTYVTIIFLPLGFATSFFSMNGAPTNDLTVSLAKFSAAAFAVTAVLLFSARTFIATLSMFKDVIKDAINHALRAPLQRYSHEIREQSLLFKGITRSDDANEQVLDKDDVYLKNWTDSSWFWLAYLFVELPTNTISGSIGVVSKVILGMIVLPIYAMSKAVLKSFLTAGLVLKISRHLYSLSTKQLAKDKKAPKKSDDAKNGPPGKWKNLLDDVEPLSSLESLEHRLRWRVLELRMEEDDI